MARNHQNPRVFGVSYSTKPRNPRDFGGFVPHIQYKTPKIPRISGFRTKDWLSTFNLRADSRRRANKLKKIQDFRGLVPTAVARKSETGGSAQRFTEQISQPKFLAHRQNNHSNIQHRLLKDKYSKIKVALTKNNENPAAPSTAVQESENPASHLTRPSQY